MRLKIALTHAAAAAALVLAAGLGQITGTHADDASVKRQTDGTSVPDVVVLYEDGSGRLTDGQTFCAVGWSCDDQPYCPTEDSCYADYAAGRWTIVEGQR